MNPFEIWHIWIMACLLFFILEIFVPSFIMASIAIGCLFAFFGAFFGGGIPIQFIFFSTGTIAGFIGVKPMMHKYMYNKSSVRTNYDGLPGRLGKVTETIDPANDSGCVAIDGDQWKAVSLNHEIIETGTKVRVVQIDSIVLTVVRAESEKASETTIPEPSPNTKASDNSSLIVGVGAKKHHLNFDDIVCFYSNSKTTFLVTNEGKEFIHDESLEKVSAMAPNDQFFHINRQFIVNRNIISAYKTGENGKIKLEIKSCNGLPSSISVSRLKAHAFRAWMKKHG